MKSKKKKKTIRCKDNGKYNIYKYKNKKKKRKDSSKKTKKKDKYF
jgi:hypothetical protein